MIGRFLKRLLLILSFLLLIFGLLAIYLVRRSFPQTDGEVRLAGLKSTVQVIRDRYGVPHIYAKNRNDLYRTQGYIHAQERFWQMDFWRHTGAGRLSELFGKSQIENDRFLRMMGWARVARKEVEQLDSVSASILRSYSEGVNAYLADHQGSKLSLEHGLLGLTNSSYKPEPWTPLDSMVWGKVMSWDLGMNLSTETYRARLLKHLPLSRVEELFPPYPSVNPYILPNFSTGQQTAKPAIFEPLDLMARQLDQLPLRNDPDAGIGSNNWVIGGSRTASGKPLLANDPHLEAQMPNIWFQIHLQCLPASEDCPFDVAGFSMAGVPGVIIGHNQQIAWAFTNIGPDVMDLFIEKINPHNPDQYEVNGEWIQMQKVEESIRVSDGTSEKVKVRYTRHGPVLSDFSKNTQDISKTSSFEMPSHYAIALRWTALDPTTTFPAIWKMNLAKNWQQFREAGSQFDVPSQNLIYADRDGNIGYQFPGKVPIRKSGDGRFPVPGWTDDHEWTGFIPFDALPSRLNPAEGYLATANNAVVNDGYDHLITRDWDYGWRARRIVEMIETHKSHIDVNYMKAMQTDNMNHNAANLVPILLSVPLNNSHLQSTRELLKGWDYQQSTDSAAAALFEVFWRNLLQQLFADEVPQNLRPGGGSRWVEVVRLLLSKPEDAWWDNRATPKKEHRDEILNAAFTNAVEELEQKLGSDPKQWRWGDLHTVTFRHASFGSSGIKPIEWLFNRGPFPTSGGSAVINATSWSATNPYEVTGLPSMRMIVDLSDFNRSVTIHTTGQSGHPFHPHYIDMAETWSNLQYQPMLWDRSVVEANAASTLTLVP